jgi:hypothetical protein
MVLSPVEVFAWQLNFLPQSGEPVPYSIFKTDKRSGKKLVDKGPRFIVMSGPRFWSQFTLTAFRLVIIYNKGLFDSAISFR